MSKTQEVMTSVGKWVLKKPKAGIRNKALKAAESDSGNFKKTVLMEELLPKCVQQRPDGYDTTVPIEQQLDDLEIEDYDLLFEALTTLIASSADVRATEEQMEEKKTLLTPSPSNSDSPIPSDTKL